MNREQLLNEWLAQIFKNEPTERLPLAGDASLRRYYRLYHQGESYVVMDAPPPESPKLFTEVAALLESQGLTVPKVRARDFQHGFLLLSDFGDRLYLNELNEHSVFPLYEDALKALIQIQQCRAPLPLFDKALAKQQLDVLFKGWYLKTHLNFEDSQVANALDAVFDTLLEEIDVQPKAFMHRDYHSRNLMILDASHSSHSSHFSNSISTIKNPGILDFQDALIGPVTYDLVSLLQDCYISWPRPWVEDWVKDFQRRLVHADHIPKNLSPDTFLRWFDFTGLQRHLKNLGIFARKYHRDNNPSYLKDIPMPLKYIRETCERYSELKYLANFFATLDADSDSDLTLDADADADLNLNSNSNSNSNSDLALDASTVTKKTNPDLVQK